MPDPSSPTPRFWMASPSVATRLELGRAARRRVPRSTLSILSTEGRDPLGILRSQNESRVQELVPLRIERMSVSPFTFYRGTAAIMAADMASDPHSGIMVPSCGDAHVSNFGFYASPQRILMFDLNDFDEAAWAPWDWDVKRLVTSIVIAGQATSRDETVVQDAALAAVRAYARAIEGSTKLSPLERYYAHMDLESAVRAMDRESRHAIRDAIRDAQKRTGARAAKRLTERSDSGRMSFVELPPTMVHVDEDLKEGLEGYLLDYLQTARDDIRLLLANYVTTDIARRVVGVGSVGTRCHLIALQDGDGHAVILQAKEAQQSVLVQYGGMRQQPEIAYAVSEAGEGARVVAMQRILQAFSDPFLGYLRGPAADLYVRQFHDMKGGVDMETLEDSAFSTYAQACAVTLARAHAQSPAAPQVAGYIGNGRVIGEAILEWAYAYAALSKSDYEAFVAEHTEPAATV